MTRTVWFALLCLAGLGTVVAINAAATPPSPVAVAPPSEQHAATDDDLAPNRTTKTDRLPLLAAHDASQTAAIQEGTLFTATLPTAATFADKPEDAPAQPTVAAAADETPAPPVETHPHHRRWQDANAKLVTTPPPPHRHTRPARRHTEAANDPSRNSSKNPSKDPSKATVDALPCRQDAMGGLMRALNLSPRCGS